MDIIETFFDKLSLSRRHFARGIVAAIGATLLGGPTKIVYAYRRLRFFPIRSIEATPRFNPDTWQLRVDGLVENEIAFTHEAILQLPKMIQTKDFVCVEGWGLDNQKWEGFHLREILNQAEVKPEAEYVTFLATGGKYSDSLSLKQALKPETMLAYKLNDKWLSPQHGRPLRLIVPWMYGYKSVKWVERITLTKQQHIGYWERRGYPVNAPIAG
ncbi:MAG: molybdopterin-dependent oxidoreductase [Proteobacteria bacterium]|nr:molybdopterin-dependent oxidoreductase [Pseudomonadota bacterium]NIS70123.1 molybdopterin-dependent oxidoreductase [Pseudomonadota bacterium]